VWGRRSRYRYGGGETRKAHAKGDKPFFMYVAFLKVYQPNNPAPRWKGKSHQGNYSDAMMELDPNTGRT
jgi:hypothetical protein